MNHRLYRIAIGYFALFSLMLLGSGAWMFFQKTGFALAKITAYYGTKSVEGVWELSYPHLGGIGLFIMVLGHFFMFTPLRHHVHKGFILLFVTALLMIFTPFGLIAGWGWLSIIKFFSVISVLAFGEYYALCLIFLIKY